MVDKITLEKLLIENLGKNLIIDRISYVSGGSINNTLKISTNSGSYFVKNNSATQFPGMFEKEARGLKLLCSANEIKTPEVLAFMDYGNESFLVLKFIDSAIRKINFWYEFGKNLANLHKHSNQFFGLDHDNYIGSLYQSNNYKDSWAEFFITERLEKQVALARNNNRIDSATSRKFTNFYKHIDQIFPKEPPALLHGDLWGGNYMVDESGYPVIIDPAVYYGHREMDLGMSQLFGGFDQEFYSTYNEHYPLVSGWEKRLDYCNLYPLMVHVNLFGGGYLSSVKSILQKF